MLALYDSQEAPEIADRNGWDVFHAALSEFSDVLGTDRFRANYNRSAKAAGLVLEFPNALLPLHLQGTGVQQVVGLLGLLATAGISIVAVEEPEGNLSFSLQHRLRRSLGAMASDRRPPHQLILTSHSPGMDLAGHDFWSMQPGPDGPTITRTSAREAAVVTGSAALFPPVGSAPVSWVTEEGILRLPDAIRTRLGVEHGGGVGFVRNGDDTVILPSDEFARRLGLDEDADP